MEKKLVKETYETSKGTFLAEFLTIDEKESCGRVTVFNQFRDGWNRCGEFPTIGDAEKYIFNHKGYKFIQLYTLNGLIRP